MEGETGNGSTSLTAEFETLGSDSLTVEERNKKTWEFLDHVTKNTDEIQREVLEDILSRNAHVEYLQRHGLEGRTDRENFKKFVPVATYEDLAYDIKRIAKGDTSPVLCSDPVSEFLTSSGTSGGERKLIPMTEYELNRRPIVLNNLINPIMKRYVTDFDKGKAMYFYFIKSETKTPSGLLARPGLTSHFKSQQFRNHYPQANYTSPYKTILCTDYFQSMYSQALCGLVQNTSVVRAGGTFASGFIRAIKFVEKHWAKLASDIRVGLPDDTIVTDPEVRKAVCKVMGGPKPELAELIKVECRKDSWKGIVRRLWPNIKYIEAIVTGPMAQYVPMIDYYTDSLPLVSLFYGSSECMFGVNLNPLCKPNEVVYTLLPNMAYFEFLPTSEKEEDDTKPVDLTEVELGKEYELIITTYTGLYRYRVGDILQVAGFQSTAPQFTFVRRKSVILSIDSDKTNEVELRNAVNNASNILFHHNHSIVEYTSYVDTSTIPGHYVLFFEISQDRNVTTNSLLSKVMEDCCLAIEESLNSVYRQCRVSDGSIGPLEIRVVEGGTFDEVMNYAVNAGTSISQYKTPKCVKNTDILEILGSRVVSKHFSPKCPQWDPGYKQWRNDVMQNEIKGVGVRG